MTLYKLLKTVGDDVDVLDLLYPDKAVETVETCVALQVIAWENPNNLTYDVNMVYRYFDPINGVTRLKVQLAEGEHYTMGLRRVLGDLDHPTIQEAVVISGLCGAVNEPKSRDAVTLGDIEEVAKVSGCSTADVVNFFFEDE